jgi:hypothetical protein
VSPILAQTVSRAAALQVKGHSPVWHPTGQVRAGRGLAGVPGPAVGRLAEHAAAGAAEQPPVRFGPGFGRVLAEHAGRDGGMGTAGWGRRG